MNKNRVVHRAAAAGAGLLAAGAGITVSTAAAALFTGVPSPVLSVGNHAIDLAPPGAKDYAVSNFGTNDKPILIGGVLIVLAFAAVIAGLVGLRWRIAALGITAALGLVSLVAEITDRTVTASPWKAIIPPIVAIGVSVGALAWLLDTLRTGRTITPARVDDDSHTGGRRGDDLIGDFDRRKFLVAAMATGTVAAAGGIVSNAYGGSSAAASRKSVLIPKPTDPAGPLPTGVDFGVAGLSSYITSNSKFYRVDTALSIPDVPADSYRLKIHGDVGRELDLTFKQLLDMPLIERRITLTCVSNEVGGPYVGNATWIGVSLNDLLDKAGVKSGADAVKTTSADDWTCGTPIAAIRSSKDSMLALAMNGEPLPLAHGFPVRMIVPGLYGYVSATKWLTDIEVTRFSDFKAYWSTRGYSVEAPIKTLSRIDVPASNFARLNAGKIPVAGVAWSQGRGIKKVEVRVHGGPWNEAKLASLDTVNTWRQWMWEWDAKPGAYTIEVRATDDTGYTQTSDRVSPRPDGATGWHSVNVTVE